MEQQLPPASDIYDDEIVDFRYYLLLLRTVLYRHYKKILLFSMGCVLIALVIAQSLAPSFVATVTLHIAPRDTAVFDAAQAWYERNDPAFQKTQIGILRSYKLIRRVVEDLRLHEIESLREKSFLGQFSEGLQLGKGGDDPMDPVLSESLEIDRAAEMLESAISVKEPPIRERSYLIKVSVSLPDAELAAMAANKLAEAYIEEVFNTALERALKNQTWLTERLVGLREDLRVAEQNLQQYRESEDILGRSSGRGELDQELELVSTRYFNAREDRLALDNLHQQVKDLRAADTGANLENIPAVMTNPLVQNLTDQIFNLEQRRSELSKRYGSRHNKMIALESELSATRQSLTSQVTNVIEGIKTDYQVALKRERSLDETLSALRGKKQSQGRKGYQLRELEQEVDSKRTVYTVFLRKFNEEDASGPIQNTNVWVTDPATVPQTATGRSMQTIAMVVLLLSLMAGVGLGVVVELVDNTFKSPDDVEQKLGVDVLGALPYIVDKDVPQEIQSDLGHHYYVHSQTSTFAEAIRSVRTTLALMSINRPMKRLLVTSGEKGEGKTSVALSLAASIGMTSRVLLMDADFRRPSIRRARDGGHNERPGLSDIIDGSATVEDCLIHDEAANIDILPAGRVGSNPLELLGSIEFNSLLDDLSNQYDRVILDSAPCVPVSDSYLLSSRADAIVFVVKAASTTVSTVRTVLKRFSGLEVPVAGVILNCVNFEERYYAYKYVGYYDYHGYSDREEDV